MIRLTLALLLLLAVSACAPSSEPAPAPAADPLPRLWTLGPAFWDLPEPKLEVVLDARGRTLVDGVALDWHALRDRLVEFADGCRDEDDRMEHSEGLLVLRAHPRLPWRAAQRVIMCAADFQVRLYRIAFVAAPDGGGPEGTFALFLRKELPPHRPEVEALGHRVEVLYKTEHLARPLDILPALDGLDDDLADRGLLLDAWAKVPVEYVLEVADLLYRAGVRELHINGPPSTARNESWPASATAAVLPGMRLNRRVVEPAPSASPRAPEVQRHATLVGFAEAPPPRSYGYFYRRPDWYERPPDLAGEVVARLDALASLQGEDGAWGGGDVALTGLALVAFLECGITHRHGKWKRDVRDGLKLLKGLQGEDGDFPGGSSAHALASCAVVMAYWRTSSPLFKQRAQIALDFAVASEFPAEASAWMERARKRAEQCRFDVPKTRPAAWERGATGDRDARLVAALSGELPAAEFHAWRERVKAQPIEGRTAEDLAISILVLMAPEPR